MPWGLCQSKLAPTVWILTIPVKATLDGIVGLERLRLHISDISIYFSDLFGTFFLKLLATASALWLPRCCFANDHSQTPGCQRPWIGEIVTIEGKMRHSDVLYYTTILCYLPRYIRKGSMERMLSHVDIIDSQYAKGTPENIIAT